MSIGSLAVYPPCYRSEQPRLPELQLRNRHLELERREVEVLGGAGLKPDSHLPATDAGIALTVATPVPTASNRRRP